ncbi:MAG: ion transporter [Gemmatimonadales bacterium]|jgi:voltage-gated potassium channel|nr:ion transporter [Gemmatimonadales bacterium]
MAVHRTEVPVRAGIDRLLRDAFGNEQCGLYRAVRRALVLVVFCAIGLMTLESVLPIHDRFYGFFRISEAFVAGVFLLEYAGKVYVARSRRKYIFGASGIIDLLSVVVTPLTLTPLGLRDLKFVRVLKLGRVVADDWATIRDREVGSLGVGLRAYLVAMFAVLMVGSTLVYHVEGAIHNTAFTDIIAAMWWGAGAMTPLDSGMTPLTLLGRVIAAVTSVCSLVLFAFLIHTIGVALTQTRSDD